MMDRNREARRGAMAAVNGGGLSRRRQQRTTNLRDSPEEDGAMEMQQEPSRLRDRGIKKDRDRDRERSSSRSKRRRGERSMHGNREEGDDSSEDSIDDDDDDEVEDTSVMVRLPTIANSAQIPSSIQQQNHHHVVKKSSFSANNNGKPVRLPAPSWKVADEMIGVSIPRKARSSSLKRSQECGDVIHLQAATSPARPSPSSTTAVSPSSSNASARKKKISSGTKQHRPPKIAKSSSAASSIQEIEIEVAEVLYGMTRQAPPLVNKQENCKVDSKDTEAKSSVCSPNSIYQQQLNFPSSSSPMVVTAPKRKRPRLKFDEERPASPSTKTETEVPAKTDEVSSPKSERNTSASPAKENGVGSCDPGDAQQVLARPGSCNQVLDSKVSTESVEEGMKKEVDLISSSKPVETSCADTNINHQESPVEAKVENLREEKFSIDLMATPLPEKSSSDKDGLLDFVSDHKSLGPENKMLPSLDIAIGETEKTEKILKQEGTSEHAGNFLAQDFDLKKQMANEKIPDLQLDLGKHDKDCLSFSSDSKQQQQVPKQQQKSARIDPKQEKSAPLTSKPLPMPIAGWPGGFPSFGYMGQVPSLQAVVPMDGSLGAARTVQPQPQPPHFLQPQMRPKRCTTHCYIAQNIHYHQQITRMHPFWPAAAVNVAKQYNLNAVPPDSAAILGNPLQGGFPPLRSSGPLQHKSAPSVAMSCAGPPPKEKSSATPASASNSNTFMEAAQRKQFLLPQSSQPGSSVAAPPNMIHGPAFLFPINQQQAMANRSGAPSKPTLPTGNAAPSAAASTSSAAAGSGAAGHSSTTTMSFNYAGLSPEAQYMTILQNNAILPNSAYPFPLAAAHVGGPPPFRGTVPAQAMPFFNGPFYSSQMVPSQQQQQQLMQQHQQQQNPQNPSTSSGSSSSRKHNTQQSQQQQQRVPGGSNLHSFPTSKQPLHFLPHQARQLESEATCEDSPSTADSSRASQVQKGIYAQNFAVPMHSQNFALISPTSTTGGSHGEYKQPSVAAHQHQATKVDLTPSQAYAMSFAPFGGSAAAATPGLDFSAIVQNPAILQNLPEVARHGYPPAVAMAAAVAQQAGQHKKSHHEDGKSVGETTGANANAAVAVDGKIATVTAAAKSVAQHHSLSFSRPDNDPAASNIMSNHVDVSSRALNLLHPPVNGTQALNPSSTAPSTNVTNPLSTLPLPLSQSKQQYYQQMLQFQHQHSQQQQRMLYMQQQPPQQQPPLLQQQQMQLHQQQMLLQQHMVSRPQMMTHTGKQSPAHNTSSSSNISSTTIAARFPQGGLAGFPPSLIQGGSSGASQSPQWKTSSTNRAATPAPTSSATSSSSSAKNQIPQQQPPKQPQLNPNAHHTHISFGVSTSSNKPSISSSAAVTAISAGSPQNSVSKSSAAAGGGVNGGSPRALSTSKSVQPPVSIPPSLPLQQQQAAAKNSPSAAVSSLKPSSPITNNNSGSSNRNITTSILGHPHITSSNSNSGKKLQQQSQKQQPFQQSPLFFHNPYIQAQTSQRRQTEQPNSTTTTTTSGMISLSPASLTLAGGASSTSDSAKAAAAAAAAPSNIKGLTTQQQQQAGILQHSAQYAPATSMAPNPFMSAAFNYIQVMSPSSVSIKPTSAAATPEQKQSTASGNENVHACWKPEKR